MEIREIIFRGKIINEDRWACGDTLLHFPNEDEYFVSAMDRRYKYCKVLPETIGQYIGLTDNNNQKIFEGDIVSFRRCNALGYTTTRVGTVYYGDNYPAFYIEATTGDSWCFSEVEDVEVIGNRYDNPELLKGE
jgi:uncharacterized phage protein (TIGR01671 family)